MLKAVEKHDVNKLRKVALGYWIICPFMAQKFSKKEKPEVENDNTAIVKETGTRALKTSLLIWGSKAIKAR